MPPVTAKVDTYDWPTCPTLLMHVTFTGAVTVMVQLLDWTFLFESVTCTMKL